METLCDDWGTGRGGFKSMKRRQQCGRSRQRVVRAGRLKGYSHQFSPNGCNQAGAGAQAGGWEGGCRHPPCHPLSSEEQIWMHQRCLFGACCCIQCRQHATLAGLLLKAQPLHGSQGAAAPIARGDALAQQGRGARNGVTMTTKTGSVSNQAPNVSMPTRYPGSTAAAAAYPGSTQRGGGEVAAAHVPSANPARR